MDKNDLLYQVFESSLFQPRTHEQTYEEFTIEVTSNYIALLSRQGVMVPMKLRSLLESDLREDVLEMVRKKTYGYSSLTEFREKNMHLIAEYSKE